MAAYHNRDPALYDGDRGARHRLAARQDAQTALIGARTSCVKVVVVRSVFAFLMSITALEPVTSVYELNPLLLDLTVDLFQLPQPRFQSI
jgi:hypothetical protein